MTAPNCPGCRDRDERLAALEARVPELEAQLGKNASNSSLPPSANPPQALRRWSRIKLKKGGIDEQLLRERQEADKKKPT